MAEIICIIVTVCGAYFYKIDFCTLYSLIAIAIAWYKSWNNHAKDKAARW